MANDTDPKPIRRHTIWKHRRAGESVQVKEIHEPTITFEWLDGPNKGQEGEADLDDFRRIYQELF